MGCCGGSGKTSMMSSSTSGGNAPASSVLAKTFCWKCFTFWAAVIIVLVLVIRDERKK